LENPNGKDNSEDIGIDGKVILEWSLWKEPRKVWIGWRRQESNAKY
jgi:hypothetical protein